MVPNYSRDNLFVFFVAICYNGLTENVTSDKEVPDMERIWL